LISMPSISFSASSIYWLVQCSSNDSSGCLCSVLLHSKTSDITLSICCSILIFHNTSKILLFRQIDRPFDTERYAEQIPYDKQDCPRKEEYDRIREQCRQQCTQPRILVITLRKRKQQRQVRQHRSNRVRE